MSIMSIIPEQIPDISVEALRDAVSNLRALDVAAVTVSVWLLLKVARIARRRIVATKLRGPPRTNLLLGEGYKVNDSNDPGSLYEAWEKEYGSVYAIPSTIGLSKVVLCDTKAVQHFYKYETSRYERSEVGKFLVHALVGKSVITEVKEPHNRQRKAMTPAFSNASIRNVTSTFYDSGYKVVDAWSSILESSKDNVIEVQGWMSRVSLDSIGIAGFSHDFGTLDGKHSDVAEMFDKFSSNPPSFVFKIGLTLGLLFPSLMKLPSKRMQLNRELNTALGGAASNFMQRMRQEKLGLTPGQEDKSVIGLLVKSQSPGAELYMSEEEVLSQIKLLLVAGYETTSISLSWALAELSQNKGVQDRLREELSQFTIRDPTYEQLTNGLPYLDAVILETLRLHGPVPETARMTTEDDVIPLSDPIKDASGKYVDHIFVPKDTQVTVSIAYMNRSDKYWGADAKQFNPARWLNPEGLETRAREIQGHKHLLTFIDGPRTCLGKAFALAEFKAVLVTLVRNFEFDMRDAKAQIEVARGLLPRPRVVGEGKVDLPLRVTRL
ncbi:cytochrome P450 [Coniophora puteana RWD-64-598 SS2]|uniref:Cytochrome P450 n=1 Tax=Coniophora puteana (strain RWD-64-598) TaxID=741705 RepID=A0A5M3MU40_CONPW|nr:cytochrome P450 [Coniophora puteana RWD-64-598 SS2]EIW82626.1 cytochrome P450 [Coniophora puteana RWD-64-598 SS2]